MNNQNRFYNKSYNNYSNNRHNYYNKPRTYNQSTDQNESNEPNEYNQQRQYNQPKHYNQSNQSNQSQQIQSTDRIKRDVFIGEEVEYKLKNELLDYIYQNIDLYQLRYSILRTTEHAQQLKHQQFHVTPHYHGYNYLLIFKKLSNNITCIYLVYRIDLKFRREDNNTNQIRIYKLSNLNYLDNSDNLDSFDNTIIDGKLVFKKEEKLFLISDIYYQKSIKILNIKIVDKLEQFKNEINYLSKLLSNYFEIKLIRLYIYSDMNELVYNKIKSSDFKINGLVFIPQRSNRIFLYTNDEEFDNIKISPNLDNQTNIPNIKFPTNIDLEERTLLLQKTLIVDVYEVFTLDKTFRFGICHVPNIELSHKLRNYFETNNQLISKCVYDNKFSKWRSLY